MATAVAGAVIGINPFDQPDVEASKIETRRLTTAYEQTGALPAEQPFLVASGLAFFADPENVRAIERAMAGERSPSSCLRAHLARVTPGDYVALLAYVDRRTDYDTRLQAIRSRHSRAEPRRNVRRVRSALPALDRAGLQGWAEHRRVSADYV